VIEKPKSYTTLEEAMRALRGHAEVQTTEAGVWIKPLRSATTQERADSNRQQAQRLAALSQHADEGEKR
jgi:hypothetical protein